MLQFNHAAGGGRRYFWQLQSIGNYLTGPDFVCLRVLIKPRKQFKGFI